MIDVNKKDMGGFGRITFNRDGDLVLSFAIDGNKAGLKFEHYVRYENDSWEDTIHTQTRVDYYEPTNVEAEKLFDLIREIFFNNIANINKIKYVGCGSNYIVFYKITIDLSTIQNFEKLWNIDLN